MHNDEYNEAMAFEAEAFARRELNKRSQAAAEVVMDMQDRGPLYQYIKAAGDHAAKCLVDLAGVDPTDTPRIIELQREVNLYLDALDFLHSRLMDGKAVEAEIEQNFGPKEEEIPNDY